METRHPYDNGEELFYPDGKTQFSEEERYRHFDFMQIKYKSDRRKNYPTIEEQLDMLYWDFKNNTKNWITTIDKVKKENPKP